MVDLNKNEFLCGQNFDLVNVDQYGKIGRENLSANRGKDVLSLITVFKKMFCYLIDECEYG